VVSTRSEEVVGDFQSWFDLRFPTIAARARELFALSVVADGYAGIRPVALSIPGRLRDESDSHGRGSTSTPQGRSATLIFLITVCVAKSTTETSLDGPLAAYSSLPSGETPIPHGR